jgi:2-polyprenyl-3-methyl-5-hydroxy-6-metoxy-1,4-benzoquinol methylase
MGMELQAIGRAEVDTDRRFAFGENWRRFLAVLDETRIAQAQHSFCETLGVDSLTDKTFLDIGSGSGVHSLVARRLGARVHSFDYDAESVACTQEVRRRYFADDPQWTAARGSVLDRAYLASLGTWDIVYSWGVLHHTGQLWPALGNAADLVANDGLLFISLYNDQGLDSRLWLKVKRFYNFLPRGLKVLVLLPAFVWIWGPAMVLDLLRGRPFAAWRAYGARGMSPSVDLVDWVGGLPFEVSKPEQVFDFVTARGFTLTRLITCAGGKGCNQYVFRRDAATKSEVPASV